VLEVWYSSYFGWLTFRQEKKPLGNFNEQGRWKSVTGYFRERAQRSRDMTKYRIGQEADLPLEVVILLIAGMMLLITGILLFPVSAGVLPYYENGLYGLLLVMFALQMITLGKTPFGDMRRSRLLLAVGVLIAAVGIVTCFVPDIFSRIPRMLLFLCFAPGGFLLLLQMCFAKDKLRAWVKYGGIFRHLILGCSAVYGLSMLTGLLILEHSLLTTPLTAVVVLIFGAALVYLAGVLRKIYCTYPEAEKPCKGDVELSTDNAMILLMGIFMLLLGVLLIPVSLGLLPFSGSAQLGLLMVIFAVQMLASGSTPIGPFPRSWLMILSGFVFAALGTVSCIIPEILVPQLTVLIGVLNILGGVMTLGKICIPRLRKSEGASGPVPPVLAKLFATQLTMNLLTILFGTSMLVSQLIPGLVIGVILAANGCVLLYLLHILIILEKLQSAADSQGAGS
jgi:hypothetical protein